MEITSTAFTEGEPIPTKHTCDGSNFSPPLSWANVPTGAQSLALLVHDPDAPSGDFTHWVLFNVPPDENGLPGHVPDSETLENGARQGKNGFGKIGYGGPCPPAGDTAHRYFFRLCALDTSLDLEGGVSMDEINSAIDGHILEEARLMGTYRRHNVKAADSR